MKIHKRRFAIRSLYYCIFLLGGNFTYSQPYTVNVNTSAVAPVSPYIQSAFASAGHGIAVIVLKNDTGSMNVNIVGKLERLSPAPFIIMGNPPPMFSDVSLSASSPVIISQEILNSAFGKFNSQTATISGSINSFDSIKENGIIKLPPGQYKICFSAYNYRQLKYVSNPNLGCAFFNICKTDPPQFVRPVSSVAINSNITVVQPNSPVNFAWTPPLSACGSPGLINYELEIREIFNNQRVTDAINNPVVFQKTAISSPAFLLDLNLYPNVLQPGKKYAIRVRATAANAARPVTIENNGYSRIEAFQFGSENAITPNPVWNARAYYLPVEERKSVFWNEYDTRSGRDTLVPVAEYIACKLMQNGVAYSQDAIELLVSLNPGLKEVKAVKLKQLLNLPEFPELSALERKHFETEQAADLQPNAAETIRFKKYLDSLKETYKQRIPEKALPDIKGLIGHLDQFREKAAAMNGVTLGFINSLLSELIFGLRQSKGNMTNNEYNHLQNIVSDVNVLAVIGTPASSSGTMKAHSADNYISFASYKGAVDYFAAVDPLLPVDIIVYRPVPPPVKPIMNAPDLKGVYRVFYTARTLYNYKNPEINALSAGRLASTTHVSLPVYLKYKFWTLNMINHKMTLPQDIDIEEIISLDQKEGLKGKKTTIVLKVE